MDTATKSDINELRDLIALTKDLNLQKALKGLYVRCSQAEKEIAYLRGELAAKTDRVNSDLLELSDKHNEMLDRHDGMLRYCYAICKNAAIVRLADAEKKSDVVSTSKRPTGLRFTPRP